MLYRKDKKIHSLITICVTDAYGIPIYVACGIMGSVSDVTSFRRLVAGKLHPNVTLLADGVFRGVPQLQIPWRDEGKKNGCRFFKLNNEIFRSGRCFTFGLQPFIKETKN